MQVAEEEPHPDAEAIIRHINAKQISNKQVRHFFNLKNERYNQMDNLQSYFGPCSTSAISHLTNGGPNVFLHDVAKFLLEVAFLIARGYCMPKQRAGFIIEAYEDETIDWGYLKTEAIREQINNVKKGKSMRMILARWVTVLRISPLEDATRKTPKGRGQSSRAPAKEVVPPPEAEEPLP